MQADTALPLVAHRQPDAAWLRASREDPLEPGLAIIDAHHHFSEHWGGYLPDDLLADGEGHDIRATVYVQCGWSYRADGAAALQVRAGCLGGAHFGRLHGKKVGTRRM